MILNQRRYSGIWKIVMGKGGVYNPASEAVTVRRFRGKAGVELGF